MWSADAPQGDETGKIRWETVPFCRGRGLDLGCGPKKLFPHVIGIDNRKDTELFGIQMKPDLLLDVTDLSMFSNGSMNFVYSSHTLEHFPYEDVPKILREWWRVITVGGFLILYLPDEDTYPKVGEPGANPDHKWNVNAAKVCEAMPKGWELIEDQKRSDANEYSIFLVFRKRADKECRVMARKEPPTKTIALTRFGAAIGDILLVSSVAAGLKEQGYHVTLFSSPPADQVILTDPNIDRLIVQDDGQVPNEWLGDYWCYWRSRFERWVNLSECMETTLLANPGRMTYEWAPAARHKLMNLNYLEVQHMLARVPHDPQVRFYATDEEGQWADRMERKLLGDRETCIVGWVMSGSARTHKAWPYLDPTLTALLRLMPHVRVVLMGAPKDVELAKGWENKERVTVAAGNWTLRQTLTFASYCHVMVGPETGIMNAVSGMWMPKIVFLSHSTHENLTRDWVNTCALHAPETKCPGRGNNEAPACHQMHYTFEPACRRHEGLGVAQCQAEITPERVWPILERAIHTGVAKE